MSIKELKNWLKDHPVWLSLVVMFIISVTLLILLSTVLESEYWMGFCTGILVVELIVVLIGIKFNVNF